MVVGHFIYPGDTGEVFTPSTPNRSRFFHHGSAVTTVRGLGPNPPFFVVPSRTPECAEVSRRHLFTLPPLEGVKCI